MIFPGLFFRCYVCMYVGGEVVIRVQKRRTIAEADCQLQGGAALLFDLRYGCGRVVRVGGKKPGRNRPPLVLRPQPA